MKAEISYKEISEYVQANFGKDVAMAYVDQTTVAVTVPVKVIVTVPVTVSLSVESAQDTEVKLVYGGKYGVDMIITGVLKFLEAKCSDAIGFAKYEGDHRITLSLDKVPKLAPVFKHVRLEGVGFSDTGVTAKGSLVL